MKEIKNKRFKVTLLAIIISASFGITAMVFSLPVTIATVALGGIQGVAIAFVAGDSYRQSGYEEDNTIVTINTKEGTTEDRMRYD